MNNDSTRTDAEIAAAVRRALQPDSGSPEAHIRSTVSHGIVTLEGTVGYRPLRFDAERAVECLAGVQRVVNRIVVHPSDDPTVSDVRRSLERALERHVAREAEHIQIEIAGRIVRLYGTVESQQEKDVVLGAVRGTRGVHEVADHLRVRGS
jgi:osmotically-inducible protein OsmY